MPEVEAPAAETAIEAATSRSRNSSGRAFSPCRSRRRRADSQPAAGPPAETPPWLDDLAAARRHPLRFMWQMDADGRFSLGSDEFTRLIGARTAAGFGRPWSEIAETFGLDPDGRVFQGGRHARYLERHHLELARRWRRPIAGGTVGIADLRPDARILPAIAALAFAAISTAWRGSPRCAARTFRGANRLGRHRPADLPGHGRSRRQPTPSGSP